MYCSNCGNQITDEDKYCNKCGTKLKSNDEPHMKNSESILDETNYTTAKQESSLSIIAKCIGFMILCEICALMNFVSNPPAFLSASSAIIGIGIVVIIIALFNRPYIGECPYCKSLVKSANKAGFICPRCRKNIAVKGNKFMKIKD